MRIAFHTRRQRLPDLGSEAVFSLTCSWRRCQNQPEREPFNTGGPGAGTAPQPRSGGHLASPGLAVRGGRLGPGVQIPRVQAWAPRTGPLRLRPHLSSCICTHCSAFLQCHDQLMAGLGTHFANPESKDAPFTPCSRPCLVRPHLHQQDATAPTEHILKAGGLRLGTICFPASGIFF